MWEGFETVPSKRRSVSAVNHTLVATLATSFSCLCGACDASVALHAGVPRELAFQSGPAREDWIELRRQPLESPPASHTEEDEILVLINTTPKHIDRALAVAETWGRNVRTIFVLPKVCEVEDSKGMERVRSIQKQYSYLDMKIVLAMEMQHCYEYPPVRPWLHALQIVQRYSFKWLLKCDDDVYVNVHLLRKFLQSKAVTTCRTLPCYFGAIGYGRKQEKHRIGLKGHPFVMGGPCVVMSSSGYRKVLPVLPSCMTKPAVRMHSDTQLGRCFLQVNLSAGLYPLKARKLQQLFKHYPPSFKKLSGKTMKPFAGTTVPQKLRRADRQRLSLHTIKTRKEMHLVHEQLH